MRLERRGFVPLPAGTEPGFDHASGSMGVASTGRLMGGALVVIDRDTGDITASFSLPGAPGGVSYDVQREHLYLAVGDPAP